MGLTAQIPVFEPLGFGGIRMIIVPLVPPPLKVRGVGGDMKL